MRTRGIATVAVVLLALLSVWGYNTFRPQDKLDLTLRTPTVAAGIVEGAPVRIQGVAVGEVTDVSFLGNGQQGVTLSIDGPQARTLTNNVEAAFSAGNLFGISEVLLTPHDGGGALTDGAVIAPKKPIPDSTISGMIVTIGDVNSEAFRPHMSSLLTNFDSASEALLPLFNALGGVAQSVSDTQKLRTSDTFPVIAETLASAETVAGILIPAIRNLESQPFNHTPDIRKINQMLDGINNERTGLTGALQQILNPAAISGLQTSLPILTSLLQPILTAFPNGSATGVGIQIADLLDNVRKAMPDTPNGPVLNLRLQVYFPAIAAGLPPVTVTKLPPAPAAKPR